MTAEVNEAELGRVMEWFAKTPEGERWDLAEREKRYAVIQAAADVVTQAEYTEYRVAINGGEAGGVHRLEGGGALGYLRRATNRAVEEVIATKVEKGMVVWHFYNMGYVFRTPRSCFGIDLHFRGAERLVGVLDFLLTTHEHADHFSRAMLEAMAASGKPLVTRFFEKGMKLDGPAKLRFGEVTVDVGIGDHHFYKDRAINDMLVFDIDCGAASAREGAGSLRVVHCGDNSNVAKLPMRGGKVVDVFIYHVAVGLDVAGAIARLEPRFVLPAHILELWHPINEYRWSFADGMKAVRELEAGRVRLMTWGERWEVG